MYKKIARILSLTTLNVFGLFSPILVRAASVNSSGATATLPKLTTQNSATTLPEYLTVIRNYLLGFSGAIAVLFIVWGGLQYIASAGNEEKAKKAKATLTYAIIGLILILLAQVIFNLITGDLLSSIFTKSAPY